MKDFSILVVLTASLAMATISQARASARFSVYCRPRYSATEQLIVDATTQEVTAINGWVSISGQPNDMIVDNPRRSEAARRVQQWGRSPTTTSSMAEKLVFDNSGILFATAGNPGGSWNLWGNGPDNYSLYESIPTGYAIEATGTFAVSTSWMRRTLQPQRLSRRGPGR